MASTGYIGSDNLQLRLAYLAAFACSSWVVTQSRFGKPFNPLLGETFEYVRPDLGYYCATEQVIRYTQYVYDIYT